MTDHITNFNTQVTSEDVIEVENIGKQSELSEKISKKDLKDLKQNATHDLDKARLVCLTGPLSGSWLQAIPNNSNKLTSREFTALLKMRLGCPVYGMANSCEQCHTALDENGIHAITCRRGGDRTTRHNIVRDCLYELCSEAAWAPVVEKSGLLTNGSMRPGDVFIPSYQQGKGTAIDVTIVHPLQPSYILNSVERWGCAAEAAEAAKKEKYQTECENAGVIFSPFAIESLGGMGEGAIRFTNALCQRLAGRRDESRANTMCYIRQRLSVALHRAVARSVLKRDTSLLEAGGDTMHVGNSQQGEWRIAHLDGAPPVNSNVDEEPEEIHLLTNRQRGQAPSEKGKEKESDEGPSVIFETPRNNGTAAPDQVANNTNNNNSETARKKRKADVIADKDTDKSEGVTQTIRSSTNEKSDKENSKRRRK